MLSHAERMRYFIFAAKFKSQSQYKPRPRFKPGPWSQPASHSSYWQWPSEWGPTLWPHCWPFQETLCRHPPRAAPRHTSNPHMRPPPAPRTRSGALTWLHLHQLHGGG